jgi:hypothetical protein
VYCEERGKRIIFLSQQLQHLQLLEGGPQFFETCGYLLSNGFIILFDRQIEQLPGVAAAGSQFMPWVKSTSQAL